MSQGGVIDITTQPDGSRVLLRIVDTGHGIPTDFQTKVWDPFFTTKERGMGLGLPIVKGVVERHGGQITITSIPGQGTTATVLLPLFLRI